jgi:signal transduction histidine kinase
VPDGANGIERRGKSPSPLQLVARPACPGSQPCPAALQGEGVLHDARNLLGALGLYCDLLAIPGVLKPEHNHYPEQLRLLGTRSGALIENLMQSLLGRGRAGGVSTDLPGIDVAGKTTCAKSSPEGEASKPGRSADSGDAPKPVSLRSIIEGCSGLLSQVAGGRMIKVCYGAAAAVPVLVGEEAVERILVNLVRNASAALDQREQASGPAIDTAKGAPLSFDLASGPVREHSADGTSDETPGAIRIGVGLLANRVGDAKPWPFRRVRLAVEDSGCGMAAGQLERLLGGRRAPSRDNHGIGFRVVRELVAASDGDLRVMSEPGIGTRVQIEWRVAVRPAIDTANSGNERGEALLPARAGISLTSPRLQARFEPGTSSRRSGDSRADAESWGSC